MVLFFSFLMSSPSSYCISVEQNSLKRFAAMYQCSTEKYIRLSLFSGLKIYFTNTKYLFVNSFTIRLREINAHNTTPIGTEFRVENRRY